MDDELVRFEAEGLDLPPRGREGTVEVPGARIWWSDFGAGTPVVLLHGGLGHSGNWGGQVAGLVAAGYRVITVDTRGHGRSTRDGRPFSYLTLADDLEAVLDHLGVARAALVGWSDGACTALLLGARNPARVARVFFFSCNVDPSGTKEAMDFTPTVQRCLNRHILDYRRLSATPDDFEAFSEAVGLMQRTQPNLSADELASIRVPVWAVQGEGDEFLKANHPAYLAQTIPGARLEILAGVTHFAPIQRPEAFLAVLIRFLAEGPA